MLKPEVEKKARLWMGAQFAPEVRKEIETLFENENWDELTDRFYKDLEFGTGGLRGVIGYGTNRMNVYNVRMTTQGLAEYALGHSTGKPAGVIAHDSRRMSREFALETALVLAGNGIKAYLFEDLRPTPELSFAVRELKATLGVVITASHNPPEYNGYKVCWSDGGQIIAPHDKGIIERVRAIDSLDKVKRLERDEAEKRGLLEIIGKKVDERFLEEVGKQIFNQEAVDKVADRFGVVYTPLHGTGVTLVPQALERLGIKNLDVLASQKVPDSEFSTVKSPNPEEKPALKLAIERAEELGWHLVIGTDPDCDRMGAAYRDSEGNFVLINGNQIGSMFCHYVLSQLKESGKMPERPMVIKTIVTTELQRAIASDFGAELHEVLTGFKYIGDVIRRYEDEGKDRQKFVFGGEESYGYLIGSHARDKDAVVASQLISEIGAWCLSRGKTIGDYLDEIYSKYGIYMESLRSLTLKGKEGAEKITSLIEKFRNQPPGSIAGKKVVGNWDLEYGTRKDFKSGQETKSNLPQENVLVFYLEDGSKVTMRPSGTEPKVKFYFGVVRSPVAIGKVPGCRVEAAGALKKLEDQFMKEIDDLLGSL